VAFGLFLESVSPFEDPSLHAGINPTKIRRIPICPARVGSWCQAACQAARGVEVHALTVVEHCNDDFRAARRARIANVPIEANPGSQDRQATNA
jgi:hypothetical protein